MASKSTHVSTKRILIDKSNTTMVIIIAVAAFVTVFSIISCRTLLSQRSYKAKVIKEQKVALAQLKENNKAASQLVSSYKAFVSSSENIIKGNASGNSDNDGDNAKIVLDALPSKYDFPALVSSLEKLLISQNFKINGIVGTDEEVTQATATSSMTVSAPVEMPFEVSVTGNFDAVQTLMDTFQRSIRPIVVSKLSLDGKDNNLNISIKAKTYYQPEKTVQITTKVVK